MNLENDDRDQHNPADDRKDVGRAAERCICEMVESFVVMPECLVSANWQDHQRSGDENDGFDNRSQTPGLQFCREFRGHKLPALLCIVTRFAACTIWASLEFAHFSPGPKLFNLFGSDVPGIVDFEAVDPRRLAIRPWPAPTPARYSTLSNQGQPVNVFYSGGGLQR